MRPNVVKIRPILRGKDIKRYSYQWAEKWVIIAKFGSHKFLESDYPAIYNHLLQYKDKLMARGQCTNSPITDKKPYPGQHHWLELDNNPTDSYTSDFFRQKIVWNPVSGEYFFAYIEKTMFFNNSLFMITSCSNNNDFLLFLLALMNSKLYGWLMIQMTNLVQTGKYAYGAKDKIELLPIPKLQNEDIKNKILKIVNAILESKTKKLDTKIQEKELDSLIYEFYGLNADEIAFIEGGIL